jgi:ParB family transcriptional regulator, chromosome partitioning protein
MELIREFEIKKIRRNPHQPRKSFSDEEIQELADSIQELGLIHPPTARRINEEEVELISGERRLLASLKAGLEKIPLYIKSATSRESSFAALAENIQRVDLNPIEISASLHRMMKELDLSQEELAKKIGKKRSTVANFLRLLHLPPSIQKELIEKKITMGHAKAILSKETLEERLAFCHLIIDRGLSVREAEKLSQKPSVKKGRKKNPYQDIERKLSRILERKVTIHSTHLAIHCSSKDDLYELSNHLSRHHYPTDD